MRRLALLALPLFVVSCAACSNDNDDSNDAGVQRIIGTERIGWDQPAQTFEDLSALTFQISVDGNALDLLDVKCTEPATAQGFACSGKLPSLAPGRHSLQIASVGANGRRSEWSAPMDVIVAASSSSSVAPSSDGRAAQARTVTTVDHVRLRLTTVADGLKDATDLASLPDGRTLVAERGGSIREVRLDGDGSRVRSLVTMDDVDLRRRGGLLALAADPAFARNRYVYAVYTAADGFRLVRFRDTGERLEERVTLLDRVLSEAMPAAAVIRFGPDEKLYAAFDDAGDTRRAGDLGSYNGKVLRLNADATTPVDQPAGTPVFVLDVNAPYGLAWTSAAGPLWIVQTSPDARTGEVRAIVRDGPLERGRVAVRYLLPEGAEPARMVVYQRERLLAFKGDLFVAIGSAGGVLRIRTDKADPLKIVATEKLLDDGQTAVRGLSVADDGSMYLSTATALLRMTEAE